MHVISLVFVVAQELLETVYVVAIRPVPEADFTMLFVRLGPRDPLLGCTL